MIDKDIDIFEKTINQLEGLHIEISILSKKSQNDALNIFKLKLVNQVLIESNKIIGEDYKPFSDFKKFNEEDLPSNSDVTLVLSQYLNCMESFREKNIFSNVKYSNGKIDKTYWYWIDTKRETYPPKNLKK
ncbi:hypothetical protein [Tenacibaculum piscium]|uniref:hypothetical protein n=1 Tax=Tenacibaculum piscium TaxID=1458515 RepID=UPI00187B3412|nr:hypothetical protein [Tenacibaculum piscium]MBE7691285.1 hypothetical protein [Tenacibaculum piscium]